MLEGTRLPEKSGREGGSGCLKGHVYLRRVVGREDVVACREKFTYVRVWREGVGLLEGKVYLCKSMEGGGRVA